MRAIQAGARPAPVSYPFVAAVAGLLTAAAAPAQVVGWLRATRGVESPPARTNHALAADVTGTAVLLFGGFDPVLGTLGDTWSWDGSAWQAREPAASPATRQEHAMACDAARNRLVLFGGRDASGAELGDTWEWDGTTWNLVAVAGPSARTGHAVAYDAARQRVVMFGGRSNGILLGDTWEWNGSAWLAAAPQAGGPVAREGHAMAYDAAAQRIVLFGGAPLVGLLADTWQWDGAAWLPALTTNVPPARRDHALAYDNAADRLLLFGGQAAQTQDDAWQWDGVDWTPLLPTGHAPAPRAGHAMALLERDRQVVLFGGDNAASLPDTWSVAPAASPYGTGCGAPALGLVPGPSPLAIGQSATATIVDAPSMLAALAVGTSRDAFGAFPLPLTLAGIGMPGCLLLQSAELVGIGATPATATTLTAALALPNAPGLVGLHLYTQAYALAPGANATQVVVSNGVDWVVRCLGGPLPPVVESFNNDMMLEAEASAGSWGNGLGGFSRIGGDGRHGEFDVAIATDTGLVIDGRRVYEVDCDHTVVPAGSTTTGAPLVVDDGRFFFSRMRVAADQHVRFVGSVPAVVTVCGELSVFGVVETDGASITTLPITGSLAGQPGARGGAGGGRGGDGGDRCLGVGPGNGAFDGRNGQDAWLPAGHAYAGSAAGTGGRGASLYPASGLNSAQQFGVMPPVGLMYCLSASAGGGGGGFLTPGAPGQVTALLQNGVPVANQTTYWGPPSPGGGALQLFPYPPIGVATTALQHFVVGGSGGGGSASNCSLSLSLARSWAPGAGGGGGGGALALRSGFILQMLPGSRVSARGGSAANNIGGAAGAQIAPGGGGSGGTVLLQAGILFQLSGEIDVRGGSGGTFQRTGGAGNGPAGGTIEIEGGDGAAGYVRLEGNGVPSVAALGTTFPPASPANVGSIVGADDLVAVRSRFYSVASNCVPQLLGYQLDAFVNGVATTFSDDPAISPVLATVGAPVRLLFQAGVSDPTSGMIRPAGPWRPAVRSRPGTTGIDVDGGDAWRFVAIFDRALATTLNLDQLVVRAAE